MTRFYWFVLYCFGIQVEGEYRAAVCIGQLIITGNVTAAMEQSSFKEKQWNYKFTNSICPLISR